LPGVGELLAQIRAPTALSAVVLIALVGVVIKIGRALLMAAIFGAIAGGASLAQGNPPGTAGTHAVIGFGVAAVMFFLIKMAKGILMWLLITGVGVAVLLAFGFRP